MGKIGFVSSRLENANMTANLMRISPNRNKVFSLWLKQYFLSDFFQTRLNEASSATTIKTIKAPELKAIELALPLLSEQKKIAEILTTLDEAIEETDRIIEKTKEAKKGLMQKLLTRGIGHKKFKKTEIEEIPIEWEVIRLKDITQEFYNGGTPDTKIKEYWDGDIPWITGADFEDQKIRQFRRYITDKGVRNSATNVVPKDNLLVVTRTGVGKLAIAPFDIAISQDITGVILDSEKALPGYIYWYLNFKSSRLRSIIQGTSINGLLREDLESFAVPLPHIDEQKHIAIILFSIDEEIEKESNHKEHLESLKKGLMQVLLTGKIRVSV
jgi:type I restriction enzyme S subunit